MPGGLETGISPVSQLLNTLAFGAFALATRNFLTPVFQSALVGVSLIFFRKRLKHLQLGAFLHLLPILLFVFVVNSFRGQGEIIARLGIFVVVRQGILRGAYYGSVIVILFVMSRLLTRGFGESRLLSSFAAISERLAGVFVRLERPKRPADEEHGGFLLILFYILRMFQTAYAEMGGFFRNRKKGGRAAAGRRIVAYFVRVYRKAMAEFDRAEHEVELAAAARSGFGAADGLYIALQAAAIAASVIFGR